MTRIVEILDESRFVEHLSTPEDGISAETRVATIDLPTQGITECYVKTYPSLKEVFNEVTGYLIAKSLSLPCAPSAAVIVLPWHISGFNPALENPLARLSWVTTSILGHNPSTIWNFNGRGVPDAFLEDLQLWDKRHHTVAKDDWTGNVDRNIGNLLRIGKGKYVLIDHGHLYTNPHWVGCSLNHSQPSSPNKLQFMLWGNRDLPKTDAGAIVHYSQEHRLAFLRIKEELDWWATQLLSNMDRSFALNYIKQRSLNAASRLGTHYGVLEL